MVVSHYGITVVMIKTAYIQHVKIKAVYDGFLVLDVDEYYRLLKKAILPTLSFTKVISTSLYACVGSYLTMPL